MEGITPQGAGVGVGGGFRWGLHRDRQSSLGCYGRPRKRSDPVKSSRGAPGIHQPAGRDRHESESVGGHGIRGKLELRHGPLRQSLLSPPGWVASTAESPSFSVEHILLSRDLRSQRRGRKNQKRDNTDQNNSASQIFSFIPSIPWVRPLLAARGSRSRRCLAGQQRLQRGKAIFQLPIPPPAASRSCSC